MAHRVGFLILLLTVLTVSADDKGLKRSKARVIHHYVTSRSDDPQKLRHMYLESVYGPDPFELFRIDRNINLAKRFLDGTVQMHKDVEKMTSPLARGISKSGIVLRTSYTALGKGEEASDGCSVTQRLVHFFEVEMKRSSRTKRVPLHTQTFLDGEELFPCDESAVRPDNDKRIANGLDDYSLYPPSDEEVTLSSDSDISRSVSKFGDEEVTSSSDADISRSYSKLCGIGQHRGSASRPISRGGEVTSSSVSRRRSSSKYSKVFISGTRPIIKPIWVRPSDIKWPTEAGQKLSHYVISTIIGSEASSAELIYDFVRDSVKMHRREHLYENSNILKLQGEGRTVVVQSTKAPQVLKGDQRYATILLTRVSSSGEFRGCTVSQSLHLVHFSSVPGEDFGELIRRDGVKETKIYNGGVNPCTLDLINLELRPILAQNSYHTKEFIDDTVVYRPKIRKGELRIPKKHDVALT